MLLKRVHSDVIGPGAGKEPRFFIYGKRSTRDLHEFRQKEGNRVNWSYMEEVLPLYKKAALLTVRIGLLGIAFAILTGLVCSVIRHLRIPVLRALTAIYIEFSRNTPLLVQLFFLFYGFPKIGLKIPAKP